MLSVQTRRFAAMQVAVLKFFQGAFDRQELEAQTAISFLAVASSDEPPTVMDIMRSTGFSRAAASRNVDMLAEGIPGRSARGLGLVRKVADPVDVRVRRVVLTEKGRDVLDRAYQLALPAMKAGVI